MNVLVGLGSRPSLTGPATGVGPNTDPLVVYHRLWTTGSLHLYPVGTWGSPGTQRQKEGPVNTDKESKSHGWRVLPTTRIPT